MDNIREKLINLSEEKYKDFSSKLIPGCTNLIGVRIPTLRKLASEIVKGDYKEFLESDELYFEEAMLKGFVINNLKLTKEEKIEYIKWYLPKITNWSLCDSFCNSIKIKEEDKEYYFKFLKEVLKTNKVYDVRFVVVTMLCYYIDKNYLEESFKIFDNINNDDYYVKMAVAWAISMYFVNYPEETMKYLKGNKLDDFTYNKALQKIVESLKVSKDTKLIIKSMKRK